MDTTRLWLIVIGQALFVGMWVTFPWWRQWIGRALMLKSVALLLSFGVILWAQYDGLPEGVWEAVEWLVLLGVWGQVAALAWEIRRAHQQRRAVVGTNGRP